MRKKVFILSEQIDKSTNEVISYLKTRKTCSVDRLNYDQLKKEDSFKLLYLFNCKIDTYSFFWLRRGNFPSISSTSEQLFREYNIYRTYLHYIVENSNSLGSLEKEYNHNKLIDLEKAKECGLKIPSFFVIYDNKSAEEVLKNRQIQYITKALNDPVRFEFEREVFYGGFTSNVLREDLDSCQFKFPSLLQEKIEKEFEIRSFFVNEKFFSMAIFSQNDKQTSVDFRHYNMEKPNRNIPFQLPEYMEDKLTVLMKKLGLNTGSIDLIYSTKKEFIFLEVNPCGQFGWMSENCNYYIERHIAKLLYNGYNG